MDPKPTVAYSSFAAFREGFWVPQTKAPAQLQLLSSATTIPMSLDFPVLFLEHTVEFLEAR